MNGPDPDTKHPMEGFPQVCFSVGRCRAFERLREGRLISFSGQQFRRKRLTGIGRGALSNHLFPKHCILGRTPGRQHMEKTVDACPQLVRTLELQVSHLT